MYKKLKPHFEIFPKFNADGNSIVNPGPFAMNGNLKIIKEKKRKESQVVILGFSGFWGPEQNGIKGFQSVLSDLLGLIIADDNSTTTTSGARARQLFFPTYY